jgi:hypothetical protein
MPSLEDFREKMNRNADEAMKEYVLLVDCVSLDYAPALGGPPIQDEFKIVPVIFEFSAEGTKSFITMRGRKASDPAGRDISYLPWKNAASGAVAKATLDGSGPAYFSTSQLDGCRFTIQYHDANRQTVTVQHLAGDLGGSGTDGSVARDLKEAENMPAGAKPELRRRLSFGPGEGKLGKVGRDYKATRPDTIYYDGGKSSVFGYRNSAGAWVFYAQDIDNRTNKGKGLKNLGTGASVGGPINANAQT